MKKLALAFSWLLLTAILLSGCREGPGESGTFRIPVTFGDGTEGEYEFIGEEGKIGMLVGGGDIVVDDTQKYMWFIWQDEDVFRPTVTTKIAATHVKSGETMDVVDVTGTAMMDLNVHKVPSSITFPRTGLWKLEAHLDNEYFTEIFVNVKENDHPDHVSSS